MIVAVHPDHLGRETHLDVGDVFDLAHQVVRHRAPEIVRPHQQRDAPSVARQEHCRLAGRVGRADHEDVFAEARRRFCRGRAVEDAAPRQRVRPRDLELAVRDPRGEQHSVGDHLATVREPNRPRRRPDVEPDDIASGEDLGAELVSLPPRPVGELCARDPVGEPEVVLDPRALARLPAGGLALDQHGAQTLGRRVHRRAEARRPAADDHDVVEVGGRRRRQSHLCRQVAHAGLDQVVAVRGHHHRDAGHVHSRRSEQALALRLFAREPAVRHGVARQEVTHLERSGRPAVPDDLRLGDGQLVTVAPHVDE